LLYCEGACLAVWVQETLEGCKKVAEQVLAGGEEAVLTYALTCELGQPALELQHYSVK
jgi:hypothetical protein